MKASLESTTAAAAGVKMPPDFRVSITNPPGKTAYPIASFTWMLIPTNPTDKTKGKMVKDMVLWALDSGEGNVFCPVVCAAAQGSRREGQGGGQSASG